jgi:hypothetical protein
MYNPEKNNPFEQPSAAASTGEILKSFEKEDGQKVMEPAHEAERPSRLTEDEGKYSPEYRQEQIKEQAMMIRKWAGAQGLVEGRDFRIIENIKDITGEKGEVVPHETKAFYMAIHEKQYRKFRDYFLSQYSHELKAKDPKNEAYLDHSWGGRFCVCQVGVPCDTVPATDLENFIASTHHQEFKKFFKSKTGFDFPTAETLNPRLKQIADEGLAHYESALSKLNEMKDAETLPGDGYGLIDNVTRAVELLKKAKIGTAVEELPEELRGEMPISMRTYADLTYNIEDIGNFDRVNEITGLDMPPEVRIDKIFDRYNFDRNQMEQICKDFSEYLMTKREIKA